MIFMQKFSQSILVIIILFLSTCGSTTINEERELTILKNYSPENKEKYADLLVDISRYTTNGADYHKKYYKFLIGIASDIIENKGMKIIKGSIGFYYDKKANDLTKLYLGLDIDTEQKFSQDYEKVIFILLKNYLKDVISTINSCRSIFYEDKVIGIVVGLKFNIKGSDEQVNIWIHKKDVIQFEDNRLTFDELIQRSYIYNSKGKILRLLI